MTEGDDWPRCNNCGRPYRFEEEIKAGICAVCVSDRDIDWEREAKKVLGLGECRDTAYQCGCVAPVAAALAYWYGRGAVPYATDRQEGQATMCMADILLLIEALDVLYERARTDDPRSERRDRISSLLARIHDLRRQLEASTVRL